MKHRNSRLLIRFIADKNVPNWPRGTEGTEAENGERIINWGNFSTEKERKKDKHKHTILLFVC